MVNMGEEVPLNPISRSDIHRLETALIVASLLREDILQKIRESMERLTWIDSLAVAAAALARAKAGMTVSKIAEDLGRSEATIRRHLTGKTEAGKIVEETYRRFIKEGVKIDIPSAIKGTVEDFQSRIKELEAELQDAIRRNKELEEKIARVREKIDEIVVLLEK